MTPPTPGAEDQAEEHADQDQQEEKPEESAKEDEWEKPVAPIPHIPIWRLPVGHTVAILTIKLHDSWTWHDKGGFKAGTLSQPELVGQETASCYQSEHDQSNAQPAPKITISKHNFLLLWSGSCFVDPSITKRCEEYVKNLVKLDEGLF
jgi:hypothetical protein